MSWDEVLNNISPEKIVLKNKPKKITSPWTFMKAPSFKTFSVEKILGGIRFENIIYTDEIGVIANKKFNR